jgi:hypothetical protein
MAAWAPGHACARLGARASLRCTCGQHPAPKLRA